MKRVFYLFIILVISACSYSGFQYDRPEHQGMSSERLSRIDSLITTLIKKNKIHGAVTLVKKNEKIIYNKSFGFADPKNKFPYRNDDIFRIASLSKIITSVAVLMLLEEKGISLNEPIENYIPVFKNARILDTFYPADTTYTTRPAVNKITIRHLLTHTSGIGYGIYDFDNTVKAIYHKAGIIDLFTTQAITIEENVRKLAQLPLFFEPGTRYHYSEGADVLGRFIEIVSGQSLDVFLTTRIFHPLGMYDTFFYLPNSHIPRLVPFLTNNNNIWSYYDADQYDINYPITGAKTFLSGGAGLSSTVGDYSIFLSMLLNKGAYNDRRFLSINSLESIYKNQMQGIDNLLDTTSFGYSFSLKVLLEEGAKSEGGGSVGTISWTGMFNTYFFIDPEEKLIGIIFLHSEWQQGERILLDFRRCVFESLFTKGSEIGNY